MSQFLTPAADKLTRKIGRTATDEELLTMRATRARVERVQGGWQTTITRRGRWWWSRRHEQTCNVRRGGAAPRQHQLPRLDEALAEGMLLALADAESFAPGLKVTVVEQMQTRTA